MARGPPFTARFVLALPAPAATLGRMTPRKKWFWFWLIATILGITLLPWTTIYFLKSLWRDFGLKNCVIADLEITSFGSSPSEYTRELQEQLIKSPALLEVVVTDPRIARLELLQGHSNPARWIAQNLEAEFPDFPPHSSMMKLRLCVTSRYANDGITLLWRVIREYQAADKSGLDLKVDVRSAPQVPQGFH